MTIETHDIDPNSWSGLATLRGRCEAQAVEEGRAGIDLFMRGQALFSEALNDFPNYRKVSQKFSQGAKNPIQVDNFEAFKDVLEQIAAGHNDPRALAASVLNFYGRADDE